MKMNNHKRSFLTISKVVGVLVIAILLASCSDFLQEDPQSDVPVRTFFKTKSDFQQSVNGVYDQIESLYAGNQYYVIAGTRDDNTSPHSTGGTPGNDDNINIDEFRENSGNNAVLSTWRTAYDAIGRANAVITYIQDQDFEGKDQIAGEARALRAFLYFDLVRLFGKVQLVTTPTSDAASLDINTARVSLDSVYAQIETDLDTAATQLPESYTGNDRGRITKGAAQSMLGTVYLTREQYGKAVTEFEKVVSSENYQLTSNYKDLWVSENQGEDEDKEAIWRIVYLANTKNDGNNYPNWYAPNTALDNGMRVLLDYGNPFGFFTPTVDLINAYSNKDVRKDCFSRGFKKEDGSWVSGNYYNCYVDQPVVSGYLGSGADFYVLRYADVLLRYAEAINESNGGPNTAAYSAVNKVRQRAGLSDLSGLSQAAFRDSVYKEERLESPMEGKRWFDLKRTGRAVEVMNSKIASDSTGVGPVEEINSDKLLYPIPTEVITRSGVEQNPGY